VEPKLYHADEETLLYFVQHIADEHRVAILVGHNPGLSDFAALLLEDFDQNIPTSGMVTITFQTDSWKNISPPNGRMKFFDYPKKK
jgi:phosphohistidine phosphatase